MRRYQHDDHADDARRRQQRGAEVRIDRRRAQRDQVNRAIPVRFGILALQADGQRRRGGLGLCDRRACGARRPISPNWSSRRSVSRSGVSGTNAAMRRKRHPEIDAKADVDARELARHHADHRAGRAVQPDRLPDNRRVRAEPPGPEAIRKDGDRRLALDARVGRLEHAAMCGRDAKHAEVVARDDAREDLLRLAARGHVQRRKGVRREAGEASSAALIVEEVGIRRRVEAGVPLIDRVERNETILVGNRQWVEEQHVHQTEGRRGGADAERQRQQRRDREAALPGEHAQRVPDVLPCNRGVLAEGDRAEPCDRTRQRRPRPRRSFASGRIVQVVGECAFHLRAVSTAEVEGQEPRHPSEQPLGEGAIARHGGAYLSRGLGISRFARAMPSVASSRRDSATATARPSAVSR